MLSNENRALVERFMDAGCYRPTDTTLGFTDKALNALLDAARRKGMEQYVVHGPFSFAPDEKTVKAIQSLDCISR